MRHGVHGVWKLRALFSYEELVASNVHETSKLRVPIDREFFKSAQPTWC